MYCPFGHDAIWGDDVMHDWRESYLDRFSVARSEGEVFQHLAAAVTELGFEYCSYGMRAPLPMSNPRFSLHSDYPEAWADRYVSCNYFAIDPSVRHGMTQSVPLIWQANLQAQDNEFWEEASHYGLRHGWCMPTKGNAGTIGLVTMVRSSERITEQELAKKEYRMSWLVSVANGTMSQYLVKKMVPESTVELTARERETLRWSAVGKTYLEIGQILSVDGRTVKFHLVNAMRKLNATNKTEAAVKASILGLLF